MQAPERSAPVTSTRCRILFLAGELHKGGLERQLYYLVRAMDRARYRPAIAVWNYRDTDVHVPLLRSLGVPIFSLSNVSSRIGKLSAFRRLVRTVEPDVIHSYTSYTNFVASWGAVGTRAIAVGSVRSAFDWGKKGGGPLVGRLSARWPAHQIFNSFAAAEEVRRSRSVFVPRHVDVVTNGLDLETFQPSECAPDGSAQILGIGYLLRQKRWDRLVRAANELKRAGLEYKIRIVGGGPLSGELEQYARQLNVDDRVQFAPHTDDIPSLLAQSSFLVHTADNEGCPNAVMEAMACGRAVVGTDVGDMRHLVDDGKTGFVVAAGDEALLAERMAALITDRELCARMGEAGRIRAEREFGLDRLVRQTLAAYKRAGWTDALPEAPRSWGGATSKAKHSVSSGLGHAPRLCLVGPMIGRNPGYVTTPGEILTDLFASAGYRVISVSASTNRYLRLLDIVTTLIRTHRETDIQCLQVYGGASFIVEDGASFLAKLFRHHLVMVLHGGLMPEFLGRYPNWSRRVLSRADAIVAPSPFLARELERHGFRVQVIPNVVDLSEYPYRHRRHLKPRLLWMRTFHPAYNPEMAIRVLARVQKVVPETTLVIAGQDKGTQDVVQRLAHSLGLNNVARFPGYLDMAAKVREGETADIFLNTNRVDNMPVSVIEACAMGLPVVATNVGGIPDLLTDNETGLLVPDDDDSAMAAAVLRLLRDPEVAGRLSANGRQLAERSSWEQVRPQWERLFETIDTCGTGRARLRVGGTTIL